MIVRFLAGQPVRFAAMADPWRMHPLALIVSLPEPPVEPKMQSQQSDIQVKPPIGESQVEPIKWKEEKAAEVVATTKTK
ncbi:hypothetical protein Tco_1442182, partial [Tanacetum coccineum]